MLMWISRVSGFVCVVLCYMPLPLISPIDDWLIVRFSLTGVTASNYQTRIPVFSSCIHENWNRPFSFTFNPFRHRSHGHICLATGRTHSTTYEHNNPCVCILPEIQRTCFGSTYRYLYTADSQHNTHSFQSVHKMHYSLCKTHTYIICVCLLCSRASRVCFYVALFALVAAALVAQPDKLRWMRIPLCVSPVCVWCAPG